MNLPTLDSPSRAGMIGPLILQALDRKTHTPDSFSRAGMIGPLILQVLDRKAHTPDSFR